MNALSRLAQFAKARRPELAIVTFGLLLRVAMAVTYDVGVGYDWGHHRAYIQWIFEHGALPSYELNVAAYHPPLYYVLGAALLHLGFGNYALRVFSVVCGALRLLVIWLGLELHLKEHRHARLVALALATVIPSGLHMEAMGSNESLSGLLCAVALVFLPFLFAKEQPRLRWAAAAGVALGLAMLTKFSAMTVCAALAVAVALDLAFRRPVTTRELGRRLRPPVVVALIVLAISGWFFARNQRLYGKAVVTGYDGPARLVVAEFRLKPYLDRRTLGYFVGWTNDVVEFPYYPSGSAPWPRFSSILVATTFVDYLNAGFASPPTPGAPAGRANYRPLRNSILPPSVASIVGGAAIALATLLAWLVVWRRQWRERRVDRLVLLLVPLLGVVGQLHFSIEYPNDTFVPVKGAYLQFCAPPLFALFGLAVTWLWGQPGRQARIGRVLSIACLLALAAVATYTLACRVPALF